MHRPTQRGAPPQTTNDFGTCKMWCSLWKKGVGRGCVMLPATKMSSPWSAKPERHGFQASSQRSE